jgi:hypothetical protein
MERPVGYPSCGARAASCVLVAGQAESASCFLRSKVMFFKINARLLRRPGASPDLFGCTAQLWDKDPIADDLLAEATVSNASAEFLFDSEDCSSGDSFLETDPDLYVLVINSEGGELFRSKVYKNVKLGESNIGNSDVQTCCEMSFEEL